MSDDLPVISCEELHKLLNELQDDIQVHIDTYDERAAIQMPEIVGTTDDHALAALKRPERFPGEHGVAMAWLFTSKTARIWTRES